MKAYIRKEQFGWQFSEDLRSGFRYFPDSVRTHDDMVKFFIDGGHRGVSGGRFDPPQDLILVDKNNQPYDHFSVRMNHATGLHMATANYNSRKRKAFTTTEIWPEDSQLKYLQATAVHLPKDIENLKEALSYLQKEEPSTIDEFHEELNERIKAGILESLNSGPTRAEIIFEYNTGRE